MAVDKARVALVARWFARVVSLPVLALVASILLAGRPVDLPVDSTAGILSTFFLLVACIGLIVGWRWEGAGGMLAVAGILLLDAVQLFVTGALPRSWTASLVALCGFFFILSRALNVAVRHESGAALRPKSGASPG